jgi:putative drug exporter of the RND superfamily
MLSTLPLVEFTEIGFAVALGVLIDTIIVRSVLVTALTLDIGRHIWWPSALARQEPRALARHEQSQLANPESRAVTGGT